MELLENLTEASLPDIFMRWPLRLTFFCASCYHISMARRILDLSTLPWQMGPAPRQPFGPQPADDRACVTEWLPARVPGDVRNDLIAAGRIPDVTTPEGIAAGAWADDCDWWYRVALPADYAADEQVYLEADGIDYYNAIWLDDRRLAVHAGMFSRQVVSLSPWLNTAGRHELAIRIWGPSALPRQPNPPWRRAIRWLAGRLVPGIEYFPDRMLTPKAQFNFGWDFAPRLLSMGIWDEIRLVITRGAYIEELWVAGERDAGGSEGSEGKAKLRIRLTIRARTARPTQAAVIVMPENFPGPAQEQTFDLDPNLSHNLDLSLHLPAARLWWPWDQGEPSLYRVTVQLTDGQHVLDEASQLVGVRSVRRVEGQDGRTWGFAINDRPVFLRGANWVPADILPGRVTPSDYERLLGMARAAGINFLRVWGGGIREKRAFWELCDRWGIMAWQEFPLACAFLDHYPRDPAYLEALGQEARATVRALRNHPSLIAWCGGNEFNIEREQQPLGVIARAVAEEDGTRPFIPASPSAGEVHQWNVWHGFAPWTALAKEQAGMMNEFGLQALPAAETVTEMFPGRVPETLDDPRWAARKAQIAKLRWYAGPRADAGLSAAIEATQRAQAAALQAGIEACRLRRGRCTGVAFWQFNEPWPAVSWSVVDRCGRPKLAYEMLRRAYQPVSVAARFPWRRYRPGEIFAIEVWAINDHPFGWTACTIMAYLDGCRIWSQEDVTLPPAAAQRIGRCAVTLATPPRELTLVLLRAEEVLAANRYDLAVHLPGRQPLRARLLRWLADRLLGA